MFCAPQNDKPYHPTIDFSSTKQIQGKQAQSFHTAWLKEHKWLTFCVTQTLVFCFYCRLAATRGLLSFSKNGSDAFVTKCLNNWEKAKERFENTNSSMLILRHVLRLVILNNLQ